MKKTIIAILFVMLLALPIVSADTSTQAAPRDFVAKVAPVMGVQSADVAEAKMIDHCYQADETYAVYHNGLWWAWLAPVATDWGGTEPSPDLIGDGWREVVSEQEWSLRPEASTFQLLDRCAAETFFPPAPHCDWEDPYYTDESHPNGYLTYYLDGSVAEYWVVHDDCGIPNDNEVPEFGTLGALAALIAIAGIVIYRRRK